MKTKLALALAFISLPAQAAQDGNTGSSSTGKIEVSLTVAYESTEPLCEFDNGNYIELWPCDYVPQIGG